MSSPKGSCFLKEERRQKRKVWEANNPDRVRRYRRRKEEMRTVLLDELGGKCSRCGFSDYRALQVDHVHGGGTEERRVGKLRVGSPTTLSQVEEAVARYLLGELSLLCANCNWIKRFEMEEHAGYVARRRSLNKQNT